MPLATMRQIIEIGESKTNLNEKEWSALLTFQTASKNFDSVCSLDNNRNSISMWHYNQQGRFVMKVSGCKEKILILRPIHGFRTLGPCSNNGKCCLEELQMVNSRSDFFKTEQGKFTEGLNRPNNFGSV